MVEEHLPDSFGALILAKQLGISKSYAYKLLESGEITYYKVGRRKVVMKSDFLNWLKTKKQINNLKPD